MNRRKFPQQVMGAMLITLLLAGYGGDSSGPLPDPSVEMAARFGVFESRDALLEMQALGIRWSRMQISWGMIQKTNGGAYDWQAYDEWISLSQEQDLFLDLMIYPFADWDQITCHPSFATDKTYRFPCDIQLYRQFVRAVIERYDGDGNDDMPDLIFPVPHYETFNEPSGSSLLASEYVELLGITYEEVKSACPNCQVLLGGWGNWGGSQQFYLEEVLALGGADYFDIANLHYIQGDVFDGMFAVGEFYDVLAAHSVNKPIWLTEVEIYSGCDACFTEEQGAAELVKGYVRAFGLGASKLFWGVLAWNSTYPPEMEWALLIDKTGRKRPSYYALRTTVAKLDPFDQVDVLFSDADSGQVRFTLGSRNVYVLWGPAPVPAEIHGTVRVTDIMGNSTVMDASQITLSADPIFVETSHRIYLPVVLRQSS